MSWVFIRMKNTRTTHLIASFSWSSPPTIMYWWRTLEIREDKSPGSANLNIVLKLQAFGGLNLQLKQIRLVFRQKWKQITGDAFADLDMNMSNIMQRKTQQALFMSLIIDELLCSVRKHGWFVLFYFPMVEERKQSHMSWWFMNHVCSSVQH